ncbi:MAG: ABC transporter ATP-binding protein [Selenomonadaceae bacterium]
MIEFQDVCYAYGDEPILRYATFLISKGAVVSLEGPNGAGKSTLLKMLNGLIFPAEGSYFFSGKEINQKTMQENRFAKWYHQRVGFVWQNPDVQLFCSSVEEEIAFGPLQMGFQEMEIKARVETVLDLLDLTRLRYKAPYYSSGGEKKKVAIASIMVMNPSVWTLDEPFASLDEKTQKWLVGFLQELKRAGKTIILATHDREYSRSIADFSLRINEQHEVKME